MESFVTEFSWDNTPPVIICIQYVNNLVNGTVYSLHLLKFNSIVAICSDLILHNGHLELE